MTIQDHRGPYRVEFANRLSLTLNESIQTKVTENCLILLIKSNDVTLTSWLSMFMILKDANLFILVPYCGVVCKTIYMTNGLK